MIGNGVTTKKSLNVSTVSFVYPQNRFTNFEVIHVNFSIGFFLLKQR